MLELRPYQRRSIDMLWDWMRKYDGHPCMVLPTGAGKSVVIAALCQEAMEYAGTRILMLTHQRELIVQNAGKLLHNWPNAPLGIYSAGLGQKRIDAITFGGIQSMRGKAEEIGRIDLCFVDECHLISHNEEGGYRDLIASLLKINPAMRVVGLTATPFRLGHGLITDKPALFDDLIEPTSIEELQALGFLARLKSRVTQTKLSAEGVHKRGGEYIESELQKAVDTQTKNSSVVDEIITLAGDRRSWLLFCAGVEHSEHIRDELLSRGIVAEAVTGNTSNTDRDRILNDYKAGRIRAITNCSVLTTGFDAPDTDLIALLRPTMSPVLYLQMAGRGLRLKKHTDHCLVLDFAGVIAQHGPITFVRPPDKVGEGDGPPPCKCCPECGEIVHASVRVCPNLECGYIFPPPEPKPLALRDDDIQGDGLIDFDVHDWPWSIQTSKNSGKEMVVISYIGSDYARPMKEYLCLWHGGFAGKKAMNLLNDLAEKSGMTGEPTTPQELVNMMTRSKCPSLIRYRKDGKYNRIEQRDWSVVEKVATDGQWDDDIPF